MPVWRVSKHRTGDFEVLHSPSICLSGAVPNYAPQDGIVVRSPLVMADFLNSVVKGTKGPNGQSPGRYSEIGTRNGDIFACVSHFAAPGSIALEGDKRNHCPQLATRGVKHICSDYEALDTPELFPEAEVYFFWSYPEESEHLLRWIVKLEQKRKRKGLGAKLVLNFDMQYSEDNRVRGLIAEQYGGDWTNKVFFDEGGTDCFTPH